MHIGVSNLTFTGRVPSCVGRGCSCLLHCPRHGPRKAVDQQKRVVRHAQEGACFAKYLLGPWSEVDMIVQVRALFTVAACLPPAVIFIDEIDSILSARKAEGKATKRPLHRAVCWLPQSSLNRP